MTLICNIQILRPLSLHNLTTSYHVNFFDLNDDVKSIIAKHLTSDYKINKKIMTKPDDDLQKNLFNEVIVVLIHVEDLCLALQKSKFGDEIEFFKQNYNCILVEMKKIVIIINRGKN